MYSDWGRNYVGTAARLKDLYEFLKIHDNCITKKLSIREVQWHFNPPQVPHFGGLWEAAVKSAKNLLYRLIDQRAYNFEEYATIFCRIEAVLCSISSEISDGNDYHRVIYW